jgi:hypothetical protein
MSNKNTAALRKLVNEEVRKALTEATYEEGTKVKVINKSLADYNKIGVVVEQSPSGNFYTVKLKDGLAYFHYSDIRHQGTTERF